MIAKLNGVLDTFRENGAVINVGGVGYFIFASSRTLSELGDLGALVTVHVETHVREDHIHLFGFITEDERFWFQLLQTVQGVGAKAALAILSALSPNEVADSIIDLDKLNLSRADGVGPKLAARIINELKDKSIIVPSSEIKSSQLTPSSFNCTFEDAISAMVNLGYSRVEAHKAATLVGAENSSEITLDQLISSSLRELGS